METSFILAVALSVAVIIIVLGLVLALLYYRWRNHELMSGIREFLRENARLKQQISQMQRTSLYQTG